MDANENHSLVALQVNATETLELEDNRTWANTVENKHLKAVTITAITLAIYSFNTLSIFLMWKTWASRKWQDNVVVLGLFATDLLNGATSFTMSSLASWQPSLLQRPHFVEVHIFFFNICSVASIYTLAGASVVQALSVLRPLRFPLEVTPQRMLLGMLLIWAMGATAAISGLTIRGETRTLTTTYIPFLDNTAYTNILSIVGILPATSIIILCYGRIFLAVLQQKRQIAALQVTNGNTGGNQGNQEGAGYQGTVLEAIRSAKKVFIITLVYFVANFPPMVATVAIAKTDVGFYESLTYFFLLWLQVCNGFFNSLVYIMVNRNMRRALVDIFKCRCTVPVEHE